MRWEFRSLAHEKFVGRISLGISLGERINVVVIADVAAAAAVALAEVRFDIVVGGGKCDGKEGDEDGNGNQNEREGEEGCRFGCHHGVFAKLCF